MKWFADNSELHGLRSDKVPDILLFGGVIVSAMAEAELCRRLEGIKHDYGHSRAPVKWNFKDLKKLYEKKGCPDLYQRLLADSKVWRRKMFDSVKDIEFTVVVTVVEAFSKDRKKIKEKKKDLSGIVFSNGLMRFAMHVKYERPQSAQIILDWPDKNESEPFDREYATAYSKGETVGGTEYYSGPLSSLNFVDSALFTNMHHSTALQFADLVVGATREVVECCIGKREEGFGVDMARLIKHRYGGAPGEIHKRGINVSSGNRQLANQIEEGLGRLFR